MKHYSKILAALLAGICLACFALGAFGIHTTYGEVTTTVAAGALEHNGGIGLENTAELVYEYSGDVQLDDALCQQICSTMGARLSAHGVRDYRISYDAAVGRFFVELAWGSRSAYSLSLIYANLGRRGELEIRAGGEQAADGSPAGVTAETVLADNTSLTEANATVETLYSGVYLNGLRLHFGGEGRKAIRDYTEQVVQQTEGQEEVGGSFSVWIDGEMLSTREFSSAITSGVLDAGAVSATITNSSEGYLGEALALCAGPLPVGLEPFTILNNSAVDASANYKAAALMLCFAALLVSVAAVVRHRILGAVNAVCTLGFLGILAMVVTGSVNTAGGMLVTFGSFAGVVGGFLFSVLGGFFCLEDVKEQLGAYTAKRAVSQAFARSRKNGVFAVLASAVGAGVLWLLCSFLENKALYTALEVCFSFLLSAGIGYVLFILCGGYVALTLCEIPSLSKDGMFGGKQQ